MSRPLTHEEVEDLLSAAAFEALEPVELERLERHLTACSRCAAVLDEYRRIAADLGMGLPERPVDPARSAAIRARLLARARTERPVTLKQPRGSRLAALLLGRWTGWGIAAGLAGVLLMHHAVHRPIDYGWLVAGVLSLVLTCIGVYAAVQRRRPVASGDGPRHSATDHQIPKN